VNGVRLSYLISTYNRLPFLKTVLSGLMEQVGSDEEIVIVDGGSTDGTVAFVEDLRRQGAVAKFVSEPDQGQSHGTNKACFLAEGDLLMIVTDDDAYFWPGIRECREFMLDRSDVDLVGSEGAGTDFGQEDPFGPSDYALHHAEWLQSGTPFDFCGNGMMFRRSSLPLIGLFNPYVRWMDGEFALRVTASRVNIAWHRSFNWVRITQPQSVTHLDWRRINREMAAVRRLYRPTNGPGPIRDWVDATAQLGRWAAQPLRRWLRSTNGNGFSIDWEGAFERSHNWLRTQRRDAPNDFQFR